MTNRSIFIVFISASLSAKALEPSDRKIPVWYQQVDKACATGLASESCKAVFLTVFDKGHLWGDVDANLKAGREAWGAQELSVKLVDNEPNEGGFAITLENDKASPSLTLSSKNSTLPEVILTANHELVHYANSKNLIAAIPARKELIKHCITRYQELVLADENRAFRSELKFWKTAPKWFKDQLAKVRFNSRFTGIQNSSYEQHYAFIEKSFRSDAAFASHKYVQLGEYPACANDIAASALK